MGGGGISQSAGAAAFFLFLFFSSFVCFHLETSALKRLVSMMWDTQDPEEQHGGPCQLHVEREKKDSSGMVTDPVIIGTTRVERMGLWIEWDALECEENRLLLRAGLLKDRQGCRQLHANIRQRNEARREAVWGASTVCIRRSLPWLNDGMEKVGLKMDRAGDWPLFVFEAKEAVFF